MGKWIHRLTNIDPESMNADCANCGRIKIVNHVGVWKCTISKYQLGSKARRMYPSRKTGACPICLEVKNLVRDHNHDCCASNFSDSCGKCFRGYICSSCNHGLGNFKDNPKNLVRAVKYLEKSSLVP